MLIAGKYKDAITELGKVSGGDRTSARVLMAEAQAVMGDYVAAEKTLSSLPQGKDAAGAEVRLMLDEVRVATGRSAEARKDLEALYKDRPDDRNVRTALGLVRRAQGDILGGKALFDLTIAESDNNKLDVDNSEQMFQLAVAARNTENYHLSNDAFREAVRNGPQLTDVGVQWADLFIQKYSNELAAQTLEDVFKVNPYHPDAHAAMAEVILDTRYDLAAVRHHLDAAFEVDPKNARALRARASIEIDRNEWDAALATLDIVLGVNKEDVEALAMKATVAWLRDDKKTYDDLRAKTFAVNPKYAQLYRIVAKSAVREHRYVEAVELEKEAVKLKPDYWEAMAGIGLGYLRLGMEKEGVEWIDKSWVGDQYNVRAANTRDLFKQTIPKEYSVQTTKSFRIRYANEEKAVLSRYLEPTMERAFAEMSKRYKFTPKTPITLELYADRSDYGVRTVGLPDISALGVCFGQVITAMSPATGDINWGMVMWHELAHVFAIQLSNSRVPRWFTEGLSEYETLIARPEWRRENESDIYGAMANDVLPSIGDLNAEFMQPDQSAVVVAYFQSAVTIEFLVNAYGFDIIVEALKLYGKGKETPEVLKTVTGKTIAQLDAELRKYLEVRLAAYKGTFRLPTRGLDDPTPLEIKADAAPRDAKARALVALSYFYNADGEKAGDNARAALAIDPKQPIARYILAEIAVHEEKLDEAKQLYSALAAEGFDSSDVRARLAQLAENANDQAAMERHLCAAKKLDPGRAFAYEELAKLYESKGEHAKAIAELEHYAFLEQMELAPLKKLMSEFTKTTNWPKVRTYGEMATYIAPGDPDVLGGLAKAYVELGDSKLALFTYDTMLLMQPPVRRPALVHIGRARAYLATGDKGNAKKALDLAAKSEPEHPDVVDLRAKLK